jgi:putative transcriptional regulator
MSRHQAPDELLLDYAAGALPEGPALVVALHVALDPVARRTVETLSSIGGALLENEAVAEVDASALDDVLAKLDQAAVETRSAPIPAPPGFEWAPPALRPYLGKSPRWKRKLGGFDEIRLGLHDDTHRVSLLRLRPGEGLPVHRHAGAEYTVVMQGGYTDNTGNYGVGDFAVGPGAAEHEPIADPGEPCIALIALEQPIVLTGFWRWLFNPLIRRGWM